MRPQYLPRTPLNQTEAEQPILAGPIGRLVQLIAGRTEADPVAVTVALAALLATSVGMGPRIRIGATTHPIRIYALLVGKSATGRKGTAWSVAERLAICADRGLADRIKDGFGSGESIVDAFSPDPDGTAADSRLMVHADEFARVLTTASRVGDSTASVLRTAWSRDRLEARARQAKAKGSVAAAEGHICVVGEVTPRDLGRYVDDIMLGNGFIGRFLFVRCEGGPRVAPGGPDWLTPDVERAAVDLGRAISVGRGTNVTVSGDAGRWWEKMVYPGMAEALVSIEPPLDDTAGRWEAYCWRLAGLVAILEGSEIEKRHLEWALAVWRHSWSTVVAMWGPGGEAVPEFASPANRDRARVRVFVDKLWPHVAEAGPAGLSGSQVNAICGGLKSTQAAEVRREGQVLGMWQIIDRPPTGGVGRPARYIVAAGLEEVPVAQNGHKPASGGGEGTVTPSGQESAEMGR